MLGAHLLDALRSRGFEFVVVTSQGNQDLPLRDRYRDVDIARFPFDSALRGRNIEHLVAAHQGVASLKRSFRPDLIHMNLCDPSVFFHLKTVDAHPAPLLLTPRLVVTQDHAGEETVLGRALRAADWVSTNSRYNLEVLTNLIPEIAPRSSVVYNGLEMPAAKPTPLPVAAPRILLLGRLVPEKGFDVAIRAFREVATRFADARLLVVGDGSHRLELERLCSELKLANLVDFRGWIDPDDVPQAINESTLMVVPSRWEEAFGLVALQEMQITRPVVASRVGGLPEVVSDQETGLLVEREDWSGFARAVVSLLDLPERAREMGLAGRRRAQQLFSWNTHVDAYERLYRKLGAATGRMA